jgi:hypothetical protein
LDATLALLLEKVDAMTLAAMQAGDEDADYYAARDRLWDALSAPLHGPRDGMTREDADLRAALGLTV